MIEVQETLKGIAHAVIGHANSKIDKKINR